MNTRPPGLLSGQRRGHEERTADQERHQLARVIQLDIVNQGFGAFGIAAEIHQDEVIEAGLQFFAAISGAGGAVYGDTESLQFPGSRVAALRVDIHEQHDFFGQ